MQEKRFTNKNINSLTEKILDTYKGDSGINFIDVFNLPVQSKIVHILDLLMELIFPGYAGLRPVTKNNISFVVGDILCKVHTELTEQSERAFKYLCRKDNCKGCDCQVKAENTTVDLLNKLPEIRDMLKGDVIAAFSGDPAAKSYEEVVLSYPCIIAIATYRIAHELYTSQLPLIPRIMTEYAHQRTGIDINPGAKIGKGFFIDHGTGVVIGETAIIGNNVKIYQGATLGALSFPRDERGQIIKGGKRHPTIEDDVTIYAEATILGNITIGKGAVIGGNVWVKESVPAGYTVTNSNPELVYTKQKAKK